MRHLLSRTLQCVLKLSKSSMHFGDCWHIANAWLHVGSASIGYGSFSVNNAVDILWAFNVHSHSSIAHNQNQNHMNHKKFMLEKLITTSKYSVCRVFYLFSSPDHTDDQTKSLESCCILDQVLAPYTDTLDGKMEMLAMFSVQPNTLSL